MHSTVAILIDISSSHSTLFLQVWLLSIFGSDKEPLFPPLLPIAQRKSITGENLSPLSAHHKGSSVVEAEAGLSSLSRQCMCGYRQVNTEQAGSASLLSLLGHGKGLLDSPFSLFAQSSAATSSTFLCDAHQCFPG